MIWIIAYLASVIGAVLTVLAMTIMRNEQRRNVGRLGWLGLIMLSPPVAWLLLICFGGRRVSAEHRERETIEFPKSTGDASKNDAGDVDDSSDVIAQLLLARGLPRPTAGNDVQLISDSHSFRSSVVELIDSARTTLHVLTYMFGRGESTDQIADRLVAAAGRGVQVRVLVDAVGSLLAPTKTLDRIREAGGRVERFKPLSSWGRLAYLDYRNHRKLMVADARRVILGGGNLTQKELGPLPDKKTWVDLSLHVTGPAAAQFEAVFRSDWRFAADEDLPRLDPQDCPAARDSGDTSRMSVMPVGADGPQEVLDDYWLLALPQARRRVWICTPYFVPAPSAMRMIELACRRGLDVRILVPNASDLPPVDYARNDYLWQLDEMGATVLRYPDRMVHAKVGVIDEDWAMVGSANFDLRSFFLNYELATVIHDQSTVVRVADWFQSVADRCETGMPTRTRFRGAVATLARVAASEL